jgi:tRNA-2-methylthio-N6-dimethylallyladenosine synthase
MESSKKRFHLQTFGCQMNVNDSEKLAGLLSQAGYEAADRMDEADFVFVNTCAVREKATQKLYHQLGRIRKLKKQRPALKVGVGGCVAQLEGTGILGRAPHVDVLVGTHTVSRVADLLAQAEREGASQVDLDRKADAFGVPAATVAHSSPVRAFVTVMEGCNHVCSFCVVPRTRGPEINRDPDSVVAEVRALVDRGHREVMLLGQTVDAYRYDGLDFAGLLARVDAVPGLERLRFTTSHPEHITPRLADALRDLPRVCPYLHLPVQSGSDRILASMRRGYDRARYLETVRLLRDRVPDLAISSDVIVGYPGETASDFEATLSLVDEVSFEGLFSFEYSPRPGTTSRLLPDDVTGEEKARRLQAVNRLQQRRQLAANQARVGTREEVLVDSVDDRRASGRTRHFRIVHFEGTSDLLGRLVGVEVTRGGANSLQGRLSTQPVH